MKSRFWTAYIPGHIYCASYQFEKPVTKAEAREHILYQIYLDTRKRLPRGSALLPERH